MAVKRNSPLFKELFFVDLNCEKQITMSNLLLPYQIERYIPGLEGRYSATTDGRIISHPKVWMCGYYGNTKRITPKRELIQHLCRGGYLRVNLQIDNKPVHRMVHVLVAKTFIPNPLKKPEVNHKSGNKKQNGYINLEWATTSENMLHAYKTKLKFPSIGEEHGMSKLIEAQVLEIIKNDKPQGLLSKEYNVSEALISLIKNGKVWKHLYQNEIYVLPIVINECTIDRPRSHLAGGKCTSIVVYRNDKPIYAARYRSNNPACEIKGIKKAVKYLSNENKEK